MEQKYGAEVFWIGIDNFLSDLAYLVLCFSKKHFCHLLISNVIYLNNIVSLIEFVNYLNNLGVSN